MTESERKIDAFRLLYGAVALPFGGVIGALLTNVGGGSTTSDTSSGAIWPPAMLYVSLIALFAFFPAIPVVCEAIIRRKLPPGRWAVPFATVLLVVMALLMPSEAFGVRRGLWLPVISAWLTVCMALCAACRFADIKKSVFR